VAGTDDDDVKGLLEVRAASTRHHQKLDPGRRTRHRSRIVLLTVTL
jgi:hypothetical protein